MPESFASLKLMVSFTGFAAGPSKVPWVKFVAAREAVAERYKLSKSLDFIT